MQALKRPRIRDVDTYLDTVFLNEVTPALRRTRPELPEHSVSTLSFGFCLTYLPIYSIHTSWFNSRRRHWMNTGPGPPYLDHLLISSLTLPANGDQASRKLDQTCQVDGPTISDGLSAIYDDPAMPCALTCLTGDCATLFLPLTLAAVCQ